MNFCVSSSRAGSPAGAGVAATSGAAGSMGRTRGASALGSSAGKCSSGRTGAAGAAASGGSKPIFRRQSLSLRLAESLSGWRSTSCSKVALARSNCFAATRASPSCARASGRRKESLVRPYISTSHSRGSMRPGRRLASSVSRWLMTSCSPASIIGIRIWSMMPMAFSAWPDARSESRTFCSGPKFLASASKTRMPSATAFFEIGNVLKHLSSVSGIALRRGGTRLDDDRSGIIGLEFKRLIGELVAFRLIAASESALCCRDIGFDGLSGLAHGLVQIGETNLDAQIIRLGKKKLFEERDRLLLAVVLEVNFGEMEEERARFAHHALLNVKVSKLFERANLLWRELGDAFVNSDGLGEESVANEDLREALEVVNSLKGFALANVQLADGHEGDLVARLILENLLVFGDGLRDLALVQQLLCGFNVFAFVVGHAASADRLPPGSPSETFSSNRRETAELGR